jgi:hypothetical protein
MDAAEVTQHLDQFNETMMRDRISLEASIFYSAMPNYCRDTDREELLEFQIASTDAIPWLRGLLRFVGARVQRGLEKDMLDKLGPQHTVESQESSVSVRA